MSFWHWVEERKGIGEWSIGDRENVPVFNGGAAQYIRLFLVLTIQCVCVYKVGWGWNGEIQDISLPFNKCVLYAIVCKQQDV